MSGEPDFIKDFEKIDDLTTIQTSKSNTETKVAALGIPFRKDQTEVYKILTQPISTYRFL